jgi:hypothetical protein
MIVPFLFYIHDPPFAGGVMPPAQKNAKPVPSRLIPPLKPMTIVKGNGAEPDL